MQQKGAFKINMRQKVEQINALINYRGLGGEKIMEDNEFLGNFRIEFVFMGSSRLIARLLRDRWGGMCGVNKTNRIAFLCAKK